MTSPTSGEKLPVLTYSNWPEWSEFWKDHFAFLDLWQYVDPTSDVDPPTPTNTSNREIAKSLTDNVIKLRQHVAPECRKLIVGQTTARGLWTALKAGCDRGTILPLISQFEAFNSAKWDPKDTISSYTSRLRNLYLSLEGTSYQIHRDIAVHILIDRLPESYEVKGQAAKQLNLSFIETVTYLLANIKDSTTTGDNASGQALIARGRRPSRKTSTQRLHTQNASSRHSSNHSTNRRDRSNRNRLSSRDTRLICNWCKREGHLERECRIRRQQLDSGAAKLDKGRAYLVQEAQQLPQQPYVPAQQPYAPTQPNANLAQANIASALSQSHQTPQTTSYDYPAHLLLARATYINNMTQWKDPLSWILDSGASQHFSNSKSDLKDYKHFHEAKEVYLGDNTKIYAEGSGTQHLHVGTHILVLIVWYVPQLAENLLSLRLLDQSGYSMLIEHDTVFIRQQGSSQEWTMLATSKHADLYRMHVHPASLQASPRALRAKEYSTLRAWHNRLGHRNFRSVGAMMKLSVPRNPPICAACMQGKMTADSHPPVLERCSKPFERIHADLIPLDGITFGGSKHMLLLVDDYSRYSWCYFTSSKDIAAISPLLQTFINMVLTQFNTVIKSWRTDGGTGEFANSMVTQINHQFGILHQLSTSGVKQQNGLVERRVQTIKNMERSMRAGAGVLDDYRLQAEALATAVFLSNILPSAVLGDKSPHSLLYSGESPPLDFLKPWGCLVYIHLRKEHRSSSSDPRCRPAMMVGYVQGSTSIYKCLDLLTMQTGNHSEVKFDEDLFPGPWLKRPAGFKPSIAHKRNPPGSAVDTRLGQSVSGALPNVSGVPLSSMDPFWQKPQHSASLGYSDPTKLARIAQEALNSPLALRLDSQNMALRLDSQTVYTARGGVVFGTCDKTTEHDTTRELVEADIIVQGMESLSCPPRQSAKAARTDVNGDPLTYSDALLQDPIRWPPAIQEELKSHEINGTWIVQLISHMPYRCKPIPGKWVFKRKIGPDETRYKARLVIKGFLQRFGVDFMETYAPTASLAAFRLLVAIAAYYGWSLRHLDIITAFLNGDIDSEVYMEIPEGMDLDPKHFVLKLRRSLYGLKQAPRIWWDKMTSFLRSLGFHQCDVEPAIFVHGQNGRFTILLLFVDDILLTGDQEGIETFVHECTKAFKTRDMGSPRLFLGIEINQQDDKITLHQNAYIKRILERFNTPNNPVGTPLDPKHPLVEATDAELLPEAEAAEYRAAVGALIYLMICTRIDIAFTLSRLSKFVQKPGTKHAAALKRLLRYLAGTQDLGIAYRKAHTNSPQSDPILHGYSDSDFAADLNNRRSTSGFIFMLNGGPIAWKSKQQSLVTGSTHDAEYVGLAIASYEAVWLRKLILAILPQYAEHTMPSNTIHCDNQGAIATANQPSHSPSNRSKHIDIRFHIIREAIANGLIRLEYTRTTEMTADILTKALPKEVHQRHVKAMGMEAV